MSRAGDIAIDFAGEERRFCLPIGRLRAVQEKCDAGPVELLRRLETGTWRIDDVREPILQGLIGGGLDQSTATRLMLSNFDGLPMLGFVAVAQLVLLAAVTGAPDEDADKPEPTPGEGVAPTPRSNAGNSASSGSTATARSSDSAPARSIN